MSYILITNDDGVDSPALVALRRTLSALGDVAIVAPTHSWSASGHTKTMHKPMRVRPAKLADGSDAIVTTGAPSDCVALAVLGILPQRPDLVVSGINKGPNMGEDVTYSGTVAAAMEAVISRIPAIAASLDAWSDWDFEAGARVVAQIAREVLSHGLPPGTFLNVNVPSVPYEEIKGIMVTRLGRRIYKDLLVERKDPRGESYYWIGGEVPEGQLLEGTDFWAVDRHFVSVTPLNMDMTDDSLAQTLKTWNLQLPRE
jgi:5'-nucleotidase